MGVEVVVEEPVAAFRTGVVVVDFFVVVFVVLDVVPLVDVLPDVVPPVDVLPDVEVDVPVDVPVMVPVGTRLSGCEAPVFEVEVVSAVSVLIGPDSRFCFVASARSMSPLVRVPTFSTVVGGVGVVSNLRTGVASNFGNVLSVLGADSIKL